MTTDPTSSEGTMRIQLKDGAISNYCTEPSPRFIAALILTTGQTFEELFEIVTAAA